IRECRFDDVETPILFSAAGQALEAISIANNTFRRFQQGIRFAGLPQTGSPGIGFQKNLFVSPGGPEVVVDGAAAASLEGLSQGAAVELNWTEGSSETGGLDIFTDNGRRGIDPVAFAEAEAGDADS